MRDGTIQVQKRDSFLRLFARSNVAITLGSSLLSYRFRISSQSSRLMSAQALLSRIIPRLSRPNKALGLKQGFAVL